MPGRKENDRPDQGGNRTGGKAPSRVLALVVVKQAFKQFRDDNCMLLAAAIAYYSLISLAPIAVVVITLLGFLNLGQEVKQELLTRIQEVVGPNSASFIRTMIEGQARGRATIITTVVSGLLLVFSATNLFAKLKDSMNLVWDIDEQSSHSGLFEFLLSRLFALAAVLGMGILLLFLMVVDTGLVLVYDFLFGTFPLINSILLVTGEYLFSLGTGGVLFTLLFMVFPDAKMKWSDVWVGGFITSALFLIGKVLIGIYLARGDLFTTYGSAASVMILIFWLFVNTILFFIGAETAAAYARLRGSGPVKT
jgi:membrane protein